MARSLVTEPWKLWETWSDLVKMVGANDLAVAFSLYAQVNLVSMVFQYLAW